MISALALLGASCGGGASTEVGASLPASDEEVGIEPAAEGETDSAESQPEHFFPNVDVVTVADGGPANVADLLAGGDTPVLLWFWAPH